LLGARLCRGVELVLDALHFEELLAGSDLVVTGEGRIDHQTLMGKAPMGVLKAATHQNIPVIAIGGSIEQSPELEQSGFSSILSINEEGLPLHLAMRPDVARENVRRTGRKLFLSLSHTSLAKDSY